MQNFVKLILIAAISAYFGVIANWHSASAARDLTQPTMQTANAEQIVVGTRHTCVVVDNGVRCWGWNENGQVGNGTQANQYTPTSVIGLTGNAVSVAAGTLHSCVVDGGAARCWGGNNYGQLGDNTTENRLSPVMVMGLENGVRVITAGFAHSCALLNNGGVKCWGRNSNGQLGDDSTEDRSAPVDVVGLDSGVRVLVAGGNHTCAILDNGGVKCWGDNDFGQLGDSTIEDRLTPVDVQGLASGVQFIAARGWHTCAITDADVKCWGMNVSGQLGDGTDVQQSSPVSVQGLGGSAQSLALGGGHSCALLAGNSVKCWGVNDLGQLGNGSNEVRSLTPVPVSALNGEVQSLAAGGDTNDGHTCALLGSSELRCWGDNEDGELGDGTTESRNTPVQVNGFSASTLAVSTRASTAQARVGDTITYTYRITNTGNVTFTTISANDNPLGALSALAGQLPPNTSRSATLVYVIQGSDLPGPLTNTVTVTGTDTLGMVVTVTLSASVTLFTQEEQPGIIYLPHIEL